MALYPSSTYDVIIVGSGPSGIFTAYEIRKSSTPNEGIDDRKGAFH